METTVWTFSLSVPFAEWAAIYDSDDVAKMHADAGVQSLFRGVSKRILPRSALQKYVVLKSSLKTTRR